MAAIVVAEPTDRGLEADASTLGAFFAVQPLRVDRLLTTVACALEPTLT